MTYFVFRNPTHEEMVLIGIGWVLLAAGLLNLPFWIMRRRIGRRR